MDVLLLLDRSGSMQYKIDDDCYCSNDVAVPSAGSLCDDTTNCTTRWDAVVAGLKKTFESASFVHWGLKLFPSATVSLGGQPVHRQPTDGGLRRGRLGVSDSVPNR